MVEYRVVKEFLSWTPGDRFFPNCCVSGGQHKWLVANGYIVPAHLPAEAVKSVVESAAVDETPPVETAMYEHGEPRRRGRPRKSVLPGPGYEAVETGIEESEGD